jgi:integrase
MRDEREGFPVSLLFRVQDKTQPLHMEVDVTSSASLASPAELLGIRQLIAEELNQHGKLRGIRLHRGQHQVRVHPYPAEGFATVEEAFAHREYLGDLKRQGIRYLPAQAPGDLPLSHWADAALAEKEARGGKRGPLSERGRRYWHDSLRPWRGEVDAEGVRTYASPPERPAHQRWACPLDVRGKALADRPLSSLTPAEVEPVLERRAAEARSQAAYEAQALLAVLRLARRRGAQFDDRLLELEPVVIGKAKRGLALTPDELAFYCDCAPTHSWRALHLMGTTGMRLSELLTLTKDRVDVAGRRLFVPARLTKEGRDKTVPLMDDEAKLLAEQILLSPPSTPEVFTRPGGTAWSRQGFYDDVTAPTRELAVASWRRHQGLGDEAPTPFDEVTNHKLRHTAITLMRQRGLQVELIAQRVGHNDGGALILRRYRHVGTNELREALDSIGSSLLEVAAQ